MSRRWARRAVFALTLLASYSFADTKRIAVVVGNNAGSGDMPPLRYAENDAGKMARVLVELGEVSTDDVLLLQGRSGADVESALNDAKDRVAQFKRSPDTRTVVVFYFSGHSDGESLEIGRDRLTYARLKALLVGTGADVRVSVVDACRSGNSILQKGGKKSEAFAIRLNDSLNTSGDAFITSSAEDEAALESSEVRGSYFTHNLISGLRGAADVSGDRMVTLAEAYRYAYDHTVSATSVLPIGAQHPSFDFKLSGQGELVLASLQRSTSTIVVPAADRALITDLVRDQVVAEIPAGQQREVSVIPGKYGVRIFQGSQSYTGRIDVPDNERHIVAMSELTASGPGFAVAAKGGSIERPIEPVVPRSNPIVFGVGVGGTGRILTDPARNPGPKFQARLWVDVVNSQFSTLGGARLLGTFTIAGLGESSFDSTGTSAQTANEAGAHLRVGYRLGLQWPRFLLALGVEAGPGFVSQRYGNFATAWAIGGAPRLTARFSVTEAVHVYVDGEVNMTGVTLQQLTGPRVQLFTFPGVNLGVAFSL